MPLSTILASCLKVTSGEDRWDPGQITAQGKKDMWDKVSAVDAASCKLRWDETRV